MLTMSGSCTHAHWIDLLRKTIWRRSGGGFNGKTLYNFSGLKAKDESKVRRRRAKFPHSPILHYACGSMYVVPCLSTRKQQKQRIVPRGGGLPYKMDGDARRKF